MLQTLRSSFLLLVFSFCAVAAEGAGKKSFYKGPGIFSTRPSETNSLTNIKRFGPVGMGIDLLQPAFVMRISQIEEGSPAAATGQLNQIGFR